MKDLLVLSHVLPFPTSSGQQQRVRNTLLAFREKFRVTFVTIGKQEEIASIESQMSGLCDEVICLPSVYNRSRAARFIYRGIGSVKSYRTSLKLSNYVIGELEFSPERVAPLLKDRSYDCVLFEYWHAYDSVREFSEKGIPCVLDMHNILWQSYGTHRRSRSLISNWWKDRKLEKYSSVEEQAWKLFDAIIAINQAEFDYVAQKVGDRTQLFYTPMGIDLDLWKKQWGFRSEKPRIAYYGSMASAHNRQSALECYHSIMPAIWAKVPDAELWIVGSSPPAEIRVLAETDHRVKVTGFVEDARSILSEMSAVVCPWRGLYGFRSRLIEVMALGIPLVTNHDAVYGMGLKHENGILLGETHAELSELTLRLITDRDFAEEQSKLARSETEEKFSFQNTYSKLASDLDEWLDSRRSPDRIAAEKPAGNNGGAK
jgi:glycosyltransferase involved in cell wall biosynthesis